MTIEIRGPDPFVPDGTGRIRPSVATVFPRERVLVTLPGIHATQRQAFYEQVEADRPGEGDAALEGAVDLIIEEGRILIRPDPGRIPLIFEADEFLQELVSKRRIHFLNVRNTRVRRAVKRRGECWRITPPPRTVKEMVERIRSSKMGIGGRDIYFYSLATGTRWVTCREFEGLSALEDAELRAHLAEIQTYAGVRNRSGGFEVDFFLADPGFRDAIAAVDLAGLPAPALREAHAGLGRRFAEPIPPELRTDDPLYPEWRRRMFGALSARRDDAVSEEVELGLSPEFFLQVEWLPGARIEGDVVIPDPVFLECPPDGTDERPHCDPKVRAFIMNFVREYDGLEYVNVGRVVRRLAIERPRKENRHAGRRDVYVVEMKTEGNDREDVKILRMQKWGVCERLDEGKSLLRAYEETEEYTEYVLDRRLGCRQLGMNLPSRVIPRKISEIYTGSNPEARNRRIWSPYFERDYVPGIATDKIPDVRFRDQGFAERVAALLGEAAAPNLAVGRCQPLAPGADGSGGLAVIFDDGDEILVEAEDGYRLVVASHIGSFRDYAGRLRDVAEQYARPITDRAHLVPDPKAFAATYLRAFESSYRRIREAVVSHPADYRSLFADRPVDEAGSFAWRWKKVLDRLVATEPPDIVEAIRRHLPG